MLDSRIYFELEIVHFLIGASVKANTRLSFIANSSAFSQFNIRDCWAPYLTIRNQADPTYWNRNWLGHVAYYFRSSTKERRHYGSHRMILTYQINRVPSDDMWRTMGIFLHKILMMCHERAKVKIFTVGVYRVRNDIDWHIYNSINRNLFFFVANQR